MWREYNKCDLNAQYVEGSRLDLEKTINGFETVPLTAPGCPSGVDVTLWKMEGAGHVPEFSDDVPSKLIDFIYAHPKTTSVTW